MLIILLSFLTVAVTVSVHAFGTAWWLWRLRRLPRLPGTPSMPRMLSILIRTALILIALHVVEVMIWAGLLYTMPEGGLASFEEAVYFSFTTFTTLGYGDVTLAGPWRLVTGIESLNGVLLIGWSTAISFAVIQNLLGRGSDAGAS